MAEEAVVEEHQQEEEEEVVQQVEEVDGARPLELSVNNNCSSSSNSYWPTGWTCPS